MTPRLVDWGDITYQQTMGKKKSKAIIVTVGAAVIAEGSRQVSAGNLEAGLVTVAFGFILVYGREALDEQDMEAIASAIGAMEEEDVKGKNKGE